MDYFVKWESLPYADSTWEDSLLIERKWPQKVEEFQEREQSSKTPTKHCKVLRSRPKFHEVKTQPEYMMGRDKVVCLNLILLTLLIIIYLTGFGIERLPNTWLKLDDSFVDKRKLCYFSR